MTTRWSVDLAGETAIVTGGSRNIGLAIAEAYRSVGARVCVVGVSDSKALDDAVARIDPAGKEAMGALVDVSDENAVIELFARVKERFGPVTVLVNGAASRPHAPLVALDRESWQRAIDVILTGAFFTSREVFRQLPADRRGAIVNLGGLSAHRPAKDRAHVIAAKAGLIGLTRALAEEGLGRIRVNTVVPGRIDTERRPGQSNPNLDEKGSGRSLGTSEDVARAVLAFSDPKDVYVTGQTVHVDGGRYMP